MMEQTFNRDAGRQRSILITIDYEGQSLYGDDKLYRGRAICIHAPRGFGYADRNNKVVQIDREVSSIILESSRMPVAQLLDREFAYMEGELLRNSRELAAHGPACALIPIHEFEAMERTVEELRAELHRTKRAHLNSLAHNVVVRNHALRWKAMATKLRLQRNKVSDIARKLWDKLLNC